jgi:DNA-binding GntR family transcriptional regulator
MDARAGVGTLRRGVAAHVPLAPTTEGWVADWLREQIVTGAFPAGARLRQADIARQLGVSTTPVREAFRSLSSEGLVQLDANRGVVVRSLSLEECLEIQELIVVVESDNLLHSIPRIGAEDLDAAESILKSMSRAGARRSLLNRDFHLALGRPSGRERALQLLHELLTLSALHVPVDAQRIDGRREQAAGEHRALLQAARAGDAERAAEVLREHCQPIIRLLRRDLAAQRGAVTGS